MWRLRSAFPQSLLFLQQKKKPMRIVPAICSLLLLLLAAGPGRAQCDSLVEIMDPFDSTRTVAAPTVNVGFTIPSNYQTLEGYKMIEEGKIMFAYAEKDSLSSFFMTLALPERDFQTIQSGKERVFLLLSNGRVISLLNASDRGTFDPQTNMRIYNHTCVIPMDLFFLLSVEPITNIRVRYDSGYQHDLEISPKQQELLTQALVCVGERVGLFPKKP